MRTVDKGAKVPQLLTWLATQITRYPVVAVTVGFAILGLVLEVSGQPIAAQWTLSGYALVVAGVEAWRMVRALVHGKAGLDILAVAAILATVVVGEYWASLVIVLMLSGGEALEAYAGHRARRELSALLERAPQTAHRMSAAGLVSDVPIAEVSVGDRLFVHPGEVVPVDALLVSDTASLDESQLTGESLPVEHLTGDALLSGSINGAQGLTIQATAIAADSQYQRVMDLVRQASESKAPMVRLADRYAIPFTLVSFAIAGYAWFSSGDPVRFAEVLVVATPCPLLIAAPVAFISGISRAAKAGIIVKGGGVLEQLSRVATVAFDKTGTLTHGAPQVVAVRPEPGLPENELLRLAASVEQNSGHVLAASLVTAAGERGLVLSAGSDVVEVTAKGVSAVIDGRRVTVGKRAFILDSGIAVPSAAPESGQMAVYVTLDGVYAGDVLLADRVRDNAASTLKRLGELGVSNTVMLTGDLAATARFIGDELGIAEVRAECLPEDKVAIMLAEKHRPVMMVGDGVNDAPVLAAADIGVAMGAKGSTAASESADVVIMLDDFSRIARSISIGFQTTNVALQAIWLGIGCSIALMIIATFGVLPAIVGAGLQEVVDLVTILYALRALAERPDRRGTRRGTPRG
jgi:heavy metal translocating P-type ATPase